MKAIIKTLKHKWTYRNTGHGSASQIAADIFLGILIAIGVLLMIFVLANVKHDNKEITVKQNTHINS